MMAATCPIGFDVGHLREQVRAMYDRVARAPEGNFHFHRGLDYAVECLRYERDALKALPARSTSRFAGVGNPHRIGPIRAGATVLDHACGAGMDLLLAARKVGPAGKAIGVDMTPAMRECAAAAAREAGLDGIVDIRDGLFEDLPVEDSSIDYVISNGVVNLAPDKRRVFGEIFRVLGSGGQLHLADVALERELSPAARALPELWAACVGGAATEAELLALVAGAGFSDARIVERFDCFRDTSVGRKFGGPLRAYGVTLYAMK
jgi:arsenite methyltransferase